jgi:selenoprotein W-related protein
VGLADELIKEFEHLIEKLTLVPSDAGRFEVSVNGDLVYSKLQSGRHAEVGEVLGLIRGVGRAANVAPRGRQRTAGRRDHIHPGGLAPKHPVKEAGEHKA